MRPRRLLRRSTLRHLRRHPWQLALAVLGVALGVAVVVAIHLANGSARRAFRLSAEAVAGRATHEILGGPEGIPDSLYRRLRVDAGVRPAAPVVEGYVGVELGSGRTLRLLGLDPFAEAPFRGFGDWMSPATEASGAGSAEPAGVGAPAPGSPGMGDVVATLLTVPGAVLLSAGTAGELGLAAGDSLPVRVGGRLRRLLVAGVVRPPAGVQREGLRDVALADIATAQEVLGRVGRLDRIDLIVPRGAAGDSTLRRVRALLPPDARVVAAGARTRSLEEMTRAFSLNLTALSLLALIFGMFLIYDATSFSVVQRRELLGTLRALGVTRREVFGLILSEGLVLGLVGSALGLALGIGLATGLLRMVTRTVNDLYFVVSVRGVSLSPVTLLAAGLLGVLATLAASLPAALEATLSPPRAALTRSILEERFRRLSPRLALGGAAGCALGALLLLVSGRSLVAAFAALFAIVLGAAMLIPLSAVALLGLLRPLLRRTLGLQGAMAARGVVAALSRTAPAIAALAVAVSVTVALGIMIGSFRRTVEQWLATTLQADVYVSAPSPVASRNEGTLEPALVRRLLATPGIGAWSTNRSVTVGSPRGDARVVALGIGPRGRAGFDFRDGRPADVWPAFEGEGAVIVSEPFSYRNQVHVGDRVRLRTDRGEHAFPVVGVFYDYGSERGVVIMARRTYERWWTDRGYTALGLYASPGVPPETLIARLRARAGADAAATAIRSNRSLREASLRVFDRTFAITGVLRLLAFIVAFIGVVSALMALQLERRRELGVLRASGLTRGELWRLVTAQTGLMGLCAGVLSLPLGISMALVMVRVINRRSFGWTLDFRVPAGVLVEALILASAAALLAGLYPAWRMARTSPAEALREE